MKSAFSQAVSLLDKEAKKGIPILLSSFLLSSLIDVVCVGCIGLFLQMLINPQFSFSNLPLFSSLLMKISLKQLINFLGIAVVLSYASKAVIAMKIQKNLITFTQSFSLRLKMKLMSAFLYAPYVYHLQKNSAFLLSRIQENIDGYISSVVLPSLNFICGALITCCVLSFLLYANLFLTLTLMAFLAFIAFGYDFFVKKKLFQLGKVVATSGGEINKSIRHGLQGLNEIRVLGRENYFINSLDSIAKKHTYAVGTINALQLFPRYVIENIMTIFIVTVTVGGIYAGFELGKIVAMVGMFAAAGARLLPIVNQLISNASQVRAGAYNAHLIYEEFSMLHLFESGKKKYALDQKINYFSLDPNQIECRAIRFSYPNSTHAALDSINLTLHKGQSIGLIGVSGAGKSTLVNVILGFLTPQEGEILIDGKPIPDPRSWLNHFAYIPQSIFLLDDTVRRNIALGIEDNEVDAARMWRVIEMAQLKDVVEKLPNGLDTLIGESGIRLSGGQRQRIALARAFYHEREIIVMDEATSSLDNETEKEIINTIKRLKGNKTLIVIAHRLTTVEHCDVLYRLEKGKIIASGTFQEVMNYKKLEKV